MNLDVLLNYLKNFKESMLLAKQKILPTFTISEKEVNAIRQELNHSELLEMSDEHIFKNKIRYFHDWN